MTKKIPAIRELLVQLAVIQQSNPIEIEEIKRSDHHNPFFEPVNLNMQLQQLQENRENILAIASKHGAFNVRVFGSVARGEADTKSDIDLLIDYDIEKITPWFPVGLIRDLENFLNTKVDVVTTEGLKTRIREQVLQESIKL
jgi:predicted nucleotidyltransferase